MLLDSLREFVRANVAPHLQGRWTPDCETQVLWPDGRCRIPTDGNAERGEPHFDDTAYHKPVSKITAFGTTGWNYVDGRSMYGVIDLDGLNHVAGHADLDEFIRQLSVVPQVEIITSKSGQGYHLILYFNPDSLPIAKTREQHIIVAERALRWLSNQISGGLTAKTDAVGVVAWIFHEDQKPEGFRVIKQSTAFLPDDWALVDLPASPDFELPSEPESDCPYLPQHQQLGDWLKERGMGEWDGHRLTTHTHNLLQAAQDPGLKIQGNYTTISAGKDGATDRNCFCYPAENGSWRVYRFGKNTQEHESWWKSANGFTATWFNRSGKQKLDPTRSLVALADGDELFHDATGRAFVTTTLNGIKETMLVADGRYAAKLRLLYTGQTGAVAKRDNIKTAVEQLEAIALLERPEYPTAIRVAEHDGKLYIDLADRDRQVVEVRNGWRLVTDCPVRFIRPYGMLPLPTPLPGGKLADLRKFVNVEPADLPLLLAFIVGCFHPRGPYAVLQLVGEQGSAKSSVMRWIHDLVDPNLAIGNTLPNDERDMLVAAQLRWLISYDNVDGLSRKLSSLLCMLVTGAATANRKLFTDQDQSILKAKRPIIITAITNVVTASDLLDRSLTLVLPPIPPAKRKSEFAIEQELRRDGVRARIFGYILNGVSAAFADHAKVDRDLPRLADLFSWATAAEPGFGLKPGRAIDAFERQAAEESEHVVDSEFGKAIVELCEEGWKGQAKELAKKIAVGMSAREASNQLREIAPDLRRQGFSVKRWKSDGRLLIHLSKQVKATA